MKNNVSSGQIKRRVLSYHVCNGYKRHVIEMCEQLMESTSVRKGAGIVIVLIACCVSSSWKD
jgi:hypothetical protein